MTKSITSFLVALLLMAASGCTTLHASMDFFLDLGSEIPGESKDKAHAGKVDVLAWSWGMSNPGTTHTGGSTGVGKVNIQDIHLTKYVDKASPALLLRCANGKHIAKATLIARTVGRTPIEYIKMEFNEVLISGVSSGGSGGEDRLTENIHLNFGQVVLTYTPINTTIPEASLNFSWDIPGNTNIIGATGGGGGSVPQPAGGLVSTLTYVGGAPVARLAWKATAGVGYQVWISDEINGVFQRYGEPIASTGTETLSITVPADAVRKFFRIETLSAQ